MKLLTLGFNHQTAPLSLRERLVFPEQSIITALYQLKQQQAINEALILSTCNRTEIYADLEQVDDLTTWLCNYHQLSKGSLAPHWYCHNNQQAVQHLMRVACGLDSMVIGETQIFSQLKQAVDLAKQAGTLGQNFNRLVQAVYTVTKQIRTNTSIGTQPTTVASAILHLAKRIFTDIHKSRVLLIGAGEMVRLIAPYFHHQGLAQLTIANRSIAKAQELADIFAGQGIGLTDIPTHLAQADIVVSATNSPLPLLGKGMVEQALKARKHQLMLMVDLAVPRDIEPQIAQLEDVYLYHLDDLQTIIEDNLCHRLEAAKKAEVIIQLQTEHFMRKWKALSATDMIAAYRQQIEKIAQTELTWALSQLPHQPAETVLQAFAHRLSRKLMHNPTVKMRQAAYEEDLDTLACFRKFFEDQSPC